MIFKCKICGGSLNVEQGVKVAECEYCGVKQTIPTFIEPKTQEIYNRASAYLANNEFDKAENLYNQILFDSKEDADAYWNIVMCRYGVSYVKDPATGKYIPTCNRTLYSSIYSDENYKNAIKYADIDQRNLFSTNAKIIDDIQRGILAVSKNEKPFDIFISYKETDIKGIRTKDSVIAQDLYNKLTIEGYKVFFSRITLEDKAGIEYEPYIYAALASSKVMITVSSSKENIEAVWVKNEWSRFLSFAAKDSSKTLIPLYFDMDKSDLPDAFAHIPAYDMTVEGFEQDLIRGIKKLIPMPVEELAGRKRRKKILSHIGLAAGLAIVISCVISIPIFKKNLEYNDASELYNSKHYAESAWAFQSLGNYRDSKTKATAAEISWRKSVSDITEDSFAYAKSVGFERLNGEASRYGAYIDSNGNIQEFFRSGKDSADEVDAVHGKVCDVIGLYDDGCLKGALSFADDDQEIASDAVQVFKTCEGYVYLKTDGTIGTKKSEDDIVTNGRASYGERNNGRYTDWEKETRNWNNITKLVYYNDFAFSPHNVSEILLGIKVDGTILIGGNIVNININSIDFENVNDIIGADVAIGYYGTDYPAPSNVMFAFVLNNGKVRFYNVFGDYGNTSNKEISLNNRIVDCAFSVADYSLNILGSDGYVYKCNLDDMSTYKMNIGGNNVYIESYMAINKNGEPHFFRSADYYDQCLPSSFKTRIYDEFLERID